MEALERFLAAVGDTLLPRVAPPVLGARCITGCKGAAGAQGMRKCSQQAQARGALEGSSDHHFLQGAVPSPQLPNHGMWGTASSTSLLPRLVG